jgi:hypothetical protein
VARPQRGTVRSQAQSAVNERRQAAFAGGWDTIFSRQLDALGKGDNDRLNPRSPRKSLFCPNRSAARKQAWGSCKVNAARGKDEFQNGVALAHGDLKISLLRGAVQEPGRREIEIANKYFLEGPQSGQAVAVKIAVV